MILMVYAVDIICNGLGPADMWQEATQENMHIRGKKRTGRNEEIMIRINQIKLPVTHDTVQLEQKIKKALKLKADTPFQYQIVKKSIDARKKPDLFYVYSVDVETADDQKSEKIPPSGSHKSFTHTCDRGGRPCRTVLCLCINVRGFSSDRGRAW